MRFTLLGALCCASAGLGAQTAERARSTDRNARFDFELELKLRDLEAYARTIYPHRRDTPLRDLNITDDEVREVLVIARKYHMPELVNISPVVTGCPCEEGAGCTEQVYLTAHTEAGALGLQLSRHKNLWTVGAVQKWWLEYAELRARETVLSPADYLRARAQLLLSLPVCSIPAKPDPASPKIAEANPRQ
ncbi:MAG TPA: hypothetical protein VF033_12305 [Steroidobacteraceae bacterium]